MRTIKLVPATDDSAYSTALLWPYFSFPRSTDSELGENRQTLFIGSGHNAKEVTSVSACACNTEGVRAEGASSHNHLRA